MSFFENPDWLGRPGPFAYNLEYIIAIILLISLGIVLPILLRKKSHKTIKIILIALWVAALVLDTIKYSYSLINNLSKGDNNINNYGFPLWTCSMFLYLMPIGLFFKKEKIANACLAFVCTISFFAGLVNFAVPAEESLFSFHGLHKILYHFILMLTPAILLGSNYVKLNIKDIIPVMIVLVTFGIPVYIFNAIFKQDYMFTYDGSWLPIDVSFITFKPLYTLLSLIAYAFVTFLVICIYLGINKGLTKKHK